LQIPPYLSNSQRRRSVSMKMTESTHISRHPSPDQVGSTEINSPLTEPSGSDLLVSGITSTSSIATPSEATSTVDEDATAIGGWSGTPPPRVNIIKTATARKKQSSIDQKGSYRIIAVNESTNCHQCRRTTPHPKMRCCACTKRYCILCIVKRCVPPCWSQVPPR
jgi:hypothetical protein